MEIVVGDIGAIEVEEAVPLQHVIIVSYHKFNSELCTHNINWPLVLITHMFPFIWALGASMLRGEGVR